MNKRNFIKQMFQLGALGSLIWSGVSNAQEGKESKVRRTGSTGSIKFVDLRAVVRNGLLTVQATFQNDSSFERPINYRFKWLDDSKMSVANEERWKPMNLFAGQTTDLFGIAPTPMATEFII
jgi:uncharacterized protein YcfL